MGLLPQGLSPQAILNELDRADSERLSGFVKRCWHVLEPSTPYVHNWHIDAISEHLEAVTDRQITKLLINVPPGFMKSLLVSVMWPAWVWGPRGLPGDRFVTGSHERSLGTRDARKSRNLIQSEWFQEKWPIRFADDQDAKMDYENLARGFRSVVSVRGSTTGKRGDHFILDDPHDVMKASSQRQRHEAVTWFKEAARNRVNDEQTSTRVIIMQRVHEDDVSAAALEMGFEHLMLPMEFEADRRCHTVIGFKDPREEDGELLDPARFPQDAVDSLKKDMGSYAWAGQYQQRPAPRDGGLFNREWFEIVGAAPSGGKSCRGWDLASTKGGGDYSTGCKITLADGVYYIEDMVRGQWSSADVVKALKNTATQDGCRQSIPQDPGQAGKAQKDFLSKELRGHDARFSTETGDKTTRAMPFSAQAEAGNVKLVKGAWNEAFLDELCMFPNGSHDDQLDAASRAFNELTVVKRPRIWTV